MYEWYLKRIEEMAYNESLCLYVFGILVAELNIQDDITPVEAARISKLFLLAQLAFPHIVQYINKYELSRHFIIKVRHE